MKQEAFQRERAERWRRFENALLELENGAPPPGDFARAYRGICQDLALAQERGFAAGLATRLERLALRGHEQLYGVRPPPGRGWLAILLAFPQALRREWRLLLVMVLLFYGTGAVSYLAVRADPDVAYTIVGNQSATQLEQMFDPEAEHLGAPRSTSGDLAMFGYYIRNNVGIGLRCFASGIFFGLGSVFLVGFNGIVIGGSAGHIANVGYGETFWPFVVGHGAFELNAIVVCGMSGLRLGLAVALPGRRRRAESLRHAARGVMPLLYGGTAMLFVAAIIEAFWSSNHTQWPIEVFYSVGAVLWALVIGSLAFAGRARAT